jgi:cytochrome o ubiquinol oxidase subunit 3
MSFVMLGAIIVHTFNYKRDYYIPADEVTVPKKRILVCWKAMSEINANGAVSADPRALLRARTPSGERHLLGFWIYLMSDCLIFACLFAAYACWAATMRAARRARNCSTCRWWRSTRLAAAVVDHLRLRHARDAAQEPESHHRWLAVTGVFGLASCPELYEFLHLIHEGAGPQRSAFLSSFFTLVGTHGLHVTFGRSGWSRCVPAGKHGLTQENNRRLMCLSMFWHFLDVVWIGVFTFVYLMGVLP